MTCEREFTLTINGCSAGSCETKAGIDLGTGYWIGVGGGSGNNGGLAYSSQHCYYLVLTSNAAYTELYFNRYDPVANTLTLKETYAGGYSGSCNVVYDATHHVFVTLGTTEVLLFDPCDETLSTFIPTVGINPGGTLVYVPERGETFCYAGKDGANQRYLCQIDFDGEDVIRLAVIPGANRYPACLIYSAIADAIYGPWNIGASGLAKLDLATATCTQIAVMSNLGEYGACWDSTQNVLLVAIGLGGVIEYDTATDAILSTNAPADPNVDFRFALTYIASLHKVFASTHDPAADEWIGTYDTITKAFAWYLHDFDYHHLFQINDKNVMSLCNVLAGGNDTVRRLCLA